MNRWFIPLVVLLAFEGCGREPVPTKPPTPPPPKPVKSNYWVKLVNPRERPAAPDFYEPATTPQRVTFHKFGFMMRFQLMTNSPPFGDLPVREKVRVKVVAVDNVPWGQNIWTRHPMQVGLKNGPGGGVWAGHRTPSTWIPQETWFETTEDGQFSFRVMYDDTGYPEWEEPSGQPWISVRFLIMVEGAPLKKDPQGRIRAHGGGLFYFVTPVGWHEGYMGASAYGTQQIPESLDPDLLRWPDTTEKFEPPKTPPPPPGGQRNSGALSSQAFMSEQAATQPQGCEPATADIDSDNDGWPDWSEGEHCPSDPLKIEPGQCGCGLPDTDADGDGAADCVDACPNNKRLSEGPCVFGDFDGDGDVDQEDFGSFQLCFAAAVSQPVDECWRFDANRDGLVETLDLQSFEKCASGPAVTVNAVCDWYNQ